MRILTTLCGITLASSLLTACFFEGNDEDLIGLYAYQADSPWADVLARCVMAQKPSESCSLNTLPTIGMEEPAPTIADVMARVVVSHDWMGANFEALLRELPDDMLYLMQGVTAVVIGKDIRPSYYWNMTGAIYLDPMGLWLSNDELAVISTEPDFREAFADPLAFRSFWRWSKDSGGAWPYQGPNANGVRPVSDIIYPMASLLFHELAHANDLMPLAHYPSVNRADSIYSASSKLFNRYPSTLLRNDDPLTSEAMRHFAGVLYKGVRPTDEDKQTSAARIGSYFEPDVASDDYSYTSQYEDLAMLFEEAMMKLHFNIDRDMAFITPPAEPKGAACDDFIVGWGVRNRVGDLNVLPRAQFAVQQLLPQQDYSAELAAMPLPSSLPTGAGWCSSVLLQQPNFQKSANPVFAPEVPIHPSHSTRGYRLFE